MMVLAGMLLCGAAAASSPVDLASAYLAAVRSGDWPAAEALWLPEDVAAARRLEITYEGVPSKLDSASPLVLDADRIRCGEVTVAVDSVATTGAAAVIRYRLTGGITSTYYAVRADGCWRLVSPVTAVAGDWPHRSTEFLDIVIQPPRRISDEAVGTLDRFVAETCSRLGVPPDRMDVLRAGRLGYVFCDPETVGRIAGAPTRGVALLQTDAVVTSEPCHLHELAHLLVNFALQDSPLFTLPVLQEGIAVALGGRWGKSPEVMAGLGKFTIESGMIDLDALLPRNEFLQQPADLTYAPSGAFAAFLLDELGGEGFLDLYRNCSGGVDEISRWDAKMVRGKVCTALGLDGNQVHTRFVAHLASLPCGGVQTGIDAAGEVVARESAAGLTVTVIRDGDRLDWSVAGGGKAPHGAVFLKAPHGASGSEGVSSRLFTENFPDRSYGGELAAVIFSPGEVGLYDFRTDLLEAKFVADFCPSASLADPVGPGIRFGIDADLFPPPPWRIEVVPAGP